MNTIDDTQTTPLLTLAVIGALVVPLAIVLFVVLVLITGFGIMPIVLALGLAVVAAAAVVWWQISHAVERGLQEIGATRTTGDDQPRLANLVEGLALSSGVPQPELYVLDDPACNACVLADQNQAIIVTTTGLLSALNRVQLEAVVANAFARIRSGQAESATVARALFGTMLVGPFGAMVEPVAKAGFQRLVAPYSDINIDQAAVSLTRYPPGLAAALEVLAKGDVNPATASRANDHLWLVSPASSTGRSTVAPVSPLGLRIDVLHEL